MQHLRLVGVHEDGLHLLLADDEGNRFTVPLDEALRAAARRDRPRLGQLQIEVSGGLRPKDVQAMIRAGMTAEEVAERAGWSVEKVHRYEGPILAEREHVASLARQVRLRPRGGSYGGAPTLDARVAERLRTREIDADTAQWDSRRTDKGAWTVLLLFNAGGRQREAAWSFDPLARTVSAVDDEARWLSEDEDQQAPGPIPAPHLAASTRPSRVYDVEAEGGVGASARRREGETVDLMAAMRERSAQRGRRRRPKSTEVPGLDEAPEEALPLEEVARDPRDELPPPAHTHPEDDPDVVKTGTVEERVGAEAAQRKVRRTEPTQPYARCPASRPRPTPRPRSSHPPTLRSSRKLCSGMTTPTDTPTAVTTPTTTSGSSSSRTSSRRSPARRPRRRTPWMPQMWTPQSPRSPQPRPATRTRTRRVPSPRHTSSPSSRSDPSARQRADGRSRSRCPTPRDPTPSTRTATGGEIIEERPLAPRAKPAPRPAPAARRSGRPSVPSWDDIMFGRKNE